MAQKATEQREREGAQTQGNARDVAMSEAKTPRTERGRKTLRKLLDASAIEFGEKGFHEASVSSITRRAGVALGSFYTYFDSKDALFRAHIFAHIEHKRPCGDFTRHGRLCD